MPPDPLQRLLVPELARPLIPSMLTEVPQALGAYAAWLVNDASLAEVGISGAAPQLLYIGTGPSLRDRLGAHVGGPLPGISAMLAARGHCLLPLADWYHPWAGESAAPHTPLAEISRQQVQRWQVNHVRWIWTVGDGYDLARLDRLINEQQPLLNMLRRSRGMAELRSAHGYERARARWLWHAAWAASALRDALMYEDEQRHWAFTEIDEFGFPFPGEDPNYGTRPFRPTRAEAAEMLREAAREAEPNVRQAVAETRETEEFMVWWAAHCGAEFLPRGAVPIEQAMRATLLMEPEDSAPCPEQLPPEDRRADVVALARMLSGVTE